VLKGKTAQNSYLLGKQLHLSLHSVHSVAERGRSTAHTNKKINPGIYLCMKKALKTELEKCL